MTSPAAFRHCNGIITLAPESPDRMLFRGKTKMAVSAAQVSVDRAVKYILMDMYGLFLAALECDAHLAIMAVETVIIPLRQFPGPLD